MSEDGVYKVRPDKMAAARVFERVNKAMNQMSRGEKNPDQVKAELLRMYYAGAQRAGFPGASSVAGHRWLNIGFKLSNGDVVVLKWDWLPGPMVLGVCPACYLLAPSQVNSKNATRPTFVEGQLARIMGDPEADKKIVTFQITAAAGIMVDERGRLTVRQRIRCPERKRCGLTLKIEDGVAESVPSYVLRSSTSTTKRPITGPVIIVK